ncbi:MAG: malectin domain-containing carbohydrate-binding protein [Candidatus Solibacter sp.]
MAADIGLREQREQAIREELHRLCESPAFRTSKRCREFLEYIVEHTLNGPGGALKERSLGVAHFQLPRDFDAGQHSIVRVTANEVRKRLAQYYLAQNGSFHAVRIDLPPGSYSADFRWDAAAGEAPPESPACVEPAVAPPAAVGVTGTSLPATPAAGPGTETALPATAAVGLLSPHPPDDAAGTPQSRARWAAVAAAILLLASAALWWQFRGASASPPAAAAGPPSANAMPPAESTHAPASLRMTVGSTNAYGDRAGHQWLADRFFSGGTVLVRPSERILRTLDPDIYRTLRSGEFRYDIPLAPGSYELHLHFAETGLGDSISSESSGEGQRVFRVTANSVPILDTFDVVADAAGANVADERVFRNISPAADGFLHLQFSPLRGSAMLSGIEVLPVATGKVRPVRMRAGWTSSWRDQAGQEWQGDGYFQGGNAMVRGTNPAQENNSKAPDMALYDSERWGHFSYAIPVAGGNYRLTLRFCEGHLGNPGGGAAGGVGARVFDVYCNGVALLRNFDIFKEAGGAGRPLSKTFSGIRPTAQGKINLSFVPVNGLACVNAIEILDQPE